MPFFTLTENLGWVPCITAVPQVSVQLKVNAASLELNWYVTESSSFYRAECKEDGDPCWQDSCVELFINAIDNPQIYCNFEWNSLGVCLAATGPDRHDRTMRSAEELQILTRKSVIKKASPDLIQWHLQVNIPAQLLFQDLAKANPQSLDLLKHNLKGNLYKCADRAHIPHWLSAFPISTPRPDFHRPEFFRPLS